MLLKWYENQREQVHAALLRATDAASMGDSDAPDPVLCVVHSDAEPLVSLLTNWESLVGEAFGYYDSSAVAMVTAKVPIALDWVLISTVLE